MKTPWISPCSREIHTYTTMREKGYVLLKKNSKIRPKGEEALKDGRLHLLLYPPLYHI